MDELHLRVEDKGTVHLRFPIGSYVDVDVDCDECWQSGLVVDQFYREESRFPDGLCAAYQVKLDGMPWNQALHFVPRDTDEHIRPSKKLRGRLLRHAFNSYRSAPGDADGCDSSCPIPQCAASKRLMRTLEAHAEGASCRNAACQNCKVWQQLNSLPAPPSITLTSSSEPVAFVNAVIEFCLRAELWPEYFCYAFAIAVWCT